MHERVDTKRAIDGFITCTLFLVARRLALQHCNAQNHSQIPYSFGHLYPPQHFHASAILPNAVMIGTPTEVQRTQQQTARHDVAHTSETDCRKRKRGDGGALPVALKTIHIRPYPESLYIKPRHLKPLRLIHRAHLPLSFLDTSRNTSGIPIDSLFTAQIEALEPKAGEDSQPVALVAEVDGAAALYAIERVKSRVYALCRLAAWVKVELLDDGQSATLAHARPAKEQTKSGGWWQAAAIDDTCHEQESGLKRLKLSISTTVSETEIIPPQVEQPANLGDISPLFTGPMEDSTPHGLLEAPKSDHEMFESLIHQYLESLYVSRTSWAFFVKGPLARIRKAFTSDAKAARVADLVNQLRAMLLPMNSMDKKYREKLPEIIRSFPVHHASDAEADPTPKPKKRQTKKLPKLSREGFYGFEKDFCKKWWSNNHASSDRARPEETFEQLLRRRIGDLRRRETLVQIVLVLEILALESSPAYISSSDASKETQGTDSQKTEIRTKETQNKESQEIETCDSQLKDGVEEQTRKKRRKTKKPADLSLLLDLLLDKLSIWQSIEQDTIVQDADSKKYGLMVNTNNIQEQDMLVSFCVDVIVPFYNSRIPREASIVNRKFGGPGVVSPPKPERQKTKDVRKPGKKESERKQRRPLQKTLSDMMRFERSRPPSLSRSASDSQGPPRLKREASELSILDIAPARPSHRDSFTQLRHLQSRQVDMTAITAATDAKVKQKAKLEQDLKDAINTLRRPNRGEAVKEVADAVDARSRGSASMRKKTMAPPRRVLDQVRNVQVTATPRHSKASRVATFAKSGVGGHSDDLQAPSSGDFCMQSSGVRSTAFIEATPAAPRFLASMTDQESLSTPFPDIKMAVEQTPFRAGAATTPTRCASRPRAPLFGCPGDRPAEPPLSPLSRLMQRPPLNSSPPFASTDSGVAAPAAPRRASGKSEALQPVEVSSRRSSPVDGPGDCGRSIYDVLGWNDYDDEIAL